MLDRLFGNRIAEGLEWQPHVSDNSFDGRTSPSMQGIATDSHATGAFIGQPLSAGAETDSNGGSPAESGLNIVQITIGALMELCVQPHQAKVSSGGGGGGNESGWGENQERTKCHLMKFTPATAFVAEVNYFIQTLCHFIYINVSNQSYPKFNQIQS